MGPAGSSSLDSLVGLGVTPRLGHIPTFIGDLLAQLGQSILAAQTVQALPLAPFIPHDHLAMQRLTYKAWLSYLLPVVIMLKSIAG